MSAAIEAQIALLKSKLRAHQANCERYLKNHTELLDERNAIKQDVDALQKHLAELRSASTKVVSLHTYREAQQSLHLPQEVLKINRTQLETAEKLLRQERKVAQDCEHHIKVLEAELRTYGHIYEFPSQ